MNAMKLNLFCIAVAIVAIFFALPLPAQQLAAPTRESYYRAAVRSSASDARKISDNAAAGRTLSDHDIHRLNAIIERGEK